MAVWPYKIEARTRLLLRRQATYDRRNIRPVWLWVFDIESSPVDETYLQTSKILRKYRAPVSAHLYIASRQDAAFVQEGADHQRTPQVTVSLAETYRLAQVLGWKAAQYVPRAQDLFQWRNDLYEIHDQMLADQFWGTTGLAIRYASPAKKFRLDSIAPNSPIVIQLEQPPLGMPFELGGPNARS